MYSLIITESFYVEVPLQNPLCIPLSLRDIRLHFNSDNVKSSTVHELELHPEETKMVLDNLLKIE